MVKPMAHASYTASYIIGLHTEATGHVMIFILNGTGFGRFLSLFLNYKRTFSYCYVAIAT